MIQKTEIKENLKRNDKNSSVPESITTMSHKSIHRLCFTAEHYMAII